MHNKKRNNLIRNFQFLRRISNTDTFNHFICIAHEPQLHIKAAPMIHNGGILEYSFTWGRMDSTLWRKNQERNPQRTCRRLSDLALIQTPTHHHIRAFTKSEITKSQKKKKETNFNGRRMGRKRGEVSSKQPAGSGSVKNAFGEVYLEILWTEYSMTRKLLSWCESCCWKFYYYEAIRGRKTSPIENNPAIKASNNKIRIIKEACLLV